MATFLLASLIGYRLPTVADITWMICALPVGSLCGWYFALSLTGTYADQLRGRAVESQPVRPLGIRDVLWLVPVCGVCAIVILSKDMLYSPALFSFVRFVGASVVAFGLTTSLLLRQVEASVQGELDAGLLDPDEVHRQPPRAADRLGVRRARVASTVVGLLVVGSLLGALSAFRAMRGATALAPTTETVERVATLIKIWLPLSTTTFALAALWMAVDVVWMPMMLTRMLRSADKRQVRTLLNMIEAKPLTWDELSAKYLSPSWLEKAVAAVVCVLLPLVLVLTAGSLVRTTYRGLQSSDMTTSLVARLLLAMTPLVVALTVMGIGAVWSSSSLQRAARQAIERVSEPGRDGLGSA
jgi:hypothetical protein